ncbi:MAG: outer membrane beta-barrel domain-containing protein [Deltaproteobacteria bacterium]|nr:outer membrane beta-barrel domain-containing protein [Deltaproteobacteria bacterium]
MIGRKTAAATILLSAVLLASAPASADVTSEQGGELYSIERRNLMGSHEISFLVGVLPMDAFAKGLTLQGAYTYHFSHLIAWEILGGTYSFNLDTGLEKHLKETFDVQPEKEGQLYAMLQSNFVFKPLYGKLALANDRLLATELFFEVGPALGFFTAAIPVGFNAGVGLRFFLGKYFSLRFDIRDYLFLPDFKSVKNHLYLSLGLSLTFGFADEVPHEE